MTFSYRPCISLEWSLLLLKSGQTSTASVDAGIAFSLFRCHLSLLYLWATSAMICLAVFLYSFERTTMWILTADFHSTCLEELIKCLLVFLSWDDNHQFITDRSRYSQSSLFVRNPSLSRQCLQALGMYREKHKLSLLFLSSCPKKEKELLHRDFCHRSVLKHDIKAWQCYGSDLWAPSGHSKLITLSLGKIKIDFIKDKETYLLYLLVGVCECSGVVSQQWGNKLM